MDLFELHDAKIKNGNAVSMIEVRSVENLQRFYLNDNALKLTIFDIYFFLLSDSFAASK